MKLPELIKFIKNLYLSSYTTPLLVASLCVCALSASLSSEKEAEKLKERLAQEEAEAMEMEDEQNKTENTNNEKDVREESNYLVEQHHKKHIFYVSDF